MTRYVVWRPDYEQTVDDGRTIEAYSPQSACEKWAERDDCEGADYLIVRGASAEVMVAELGSSLPPFRYSVSGESVASYRATMLHGKPPNVLVSARAEGPSAPPASSAAGAVAKGL